MPFDAIVIGSGFGGSVAALRLAEAGHRVLVLERGRRWTADTLPRGPDDPWLWSHAHPERQNGWLDLRLFPNMAVAQGAAVGGGSHIYANISTEAPPSAFADGWPDGVTHAGLKPFYDVVGAMMEVAPVPANQWTRRMALMRDAALATGNGERFRQVDLAVTFDPTWTYDEPRDAARSRPVVNRHGARQGTCVHLGLCDLGCPVSARNTLDLNYLYRAETKHGVEVRPLHLVDRIAPQGTGWAVDFVRLENGERIAGTESADMLVVAAGSLGSTELLLRNRDVHGTLPNVSARLGEDWSGNGDFLTPALYTDREVDASAGPTIASVIDFEDGSVGGHRFWVQDGGIPDLLLGLMERMVDDPGAGVTTRVLAGRLGHLLRRHQPLGGVMPWFAQGVDAGNGRLSLTGPGLFSPGGELTLSWDVTRSMPLIDTIVGMHKRLSAATGGTAVVPPTWSLLKALVTPHPLGGCNMGRDAATGVVDHRGAVFGHGNLFVLDGAIVPRAIGVNPSRTIAALAERAMSLINAGDG